MAYTKQNDPWVNGSGGGTEIDADALNGMETGIANAHVTADAAVPKSVGTTAGDTIYWTGASTPVRLALGAAGTVLKGGASAPSFAAILNADVSASAAIAVSKLAPGTNGQVLTTTGGAAAWGAAAASSQQWDRAEKTTNTSVTATTEGTADTVLASNSVTYDGTSVEIEFYSPNYYHSTGSNITFVLLRGATVLGIATSNTDSNGGDFKMRARDTPSAAAHTYTVKAYVSSGTGTVGAGAGGSGNYLPAFIRITKAA